RVAARGAGLRALAAETGFPPTPDVAAAVRSRIAAAPVPAERVGQLRRWASRGGAGGAPRVGGFARRPSRRALVVAVACAFAVPAAAIAAVPSTRHAVLDWLGLRSVRVRTVPVLPPARPGPTSAPPAGDLGRRATLDRARAGLRFAVRVPGALGEPSHVFLAASPPGGRVSFVYAGPPRLLIPQFRGPHPPP